MGKHYTYECWLPDKGELFFVSDIVRDSRPSHRSGDAFISADKPKDLTVNFSGGSWQVFLSNQRYPGSASAPDTNLGSFVSLRPPNQAEEAAYALGGLAAVKQVGQP